MTNRVDQKSDLCMYSLFCHTYLVVLAHKYSYAAWRSCMKSVAEAGGGFAAKFAAVGRWMTCGK